MDIRQVQYFLAIVDTGSFSAAAEQQFISQSSLSKGIQALEKELSVSLFDRSKKRVSLTPAGEAFLRHARKIDTDHQAMQDEMNGYQSNADFFSIAAIPILPQYGIAAIISQFQDRHPHLRFSLEEIDGLNIVPALLEHRFDLAFTRNNYMDTEKFHINEISRDKLLVVVSKKSQFANHSSLSLRELKEENFILFDKVTELHYLIMDACKAVGFEPNIFYSSHRKVSVFSLVETNIGLALMPVKIFQYHRPPDVIAIPLEEDIQCNVVLAYLKDKQLPKSAEIFIDFVNKAEQVEDSK